MKYPKRRQALLCGQISTTQKTAFIRNVRTVYVPGYTVKNAVLVPDAAIGTDLVSRYVLVVGDDNRIKYNPVEVGRNVGKYAIVESGVSPDDRIVVAGLHRAVPGVLVKPIEKADDEK